MLPSNFRCPAVADKEDQTDIHAFTNNDYKSSLYQYLQQIEEELKYLLATKDNPKTSKKMKMI